MIKEMTYYLVGAQATVLVLEIHRTTIGISAVLPFQ
jgi:hypothetical protein